MADIQHDYVQTYYRPLAQTDFGALQRICDGLMEQGRLRLARENVLPEAIFFQRFLDIRYAGQEFSIPVPVPAEYIDAGDAHAIGETFNEVHERRYGYHTPEHALEIVNVRISAMGRRKRLELPVPEASGSGTALAGKRMVYFESTAEAVESPIFSRDRLESGYRITGPAVVQEYACTTVLFPGDDLVVADTGELVITIGR
jgi:N-methylhydantoinase A